mmetsp:Transcript_85920/g.161806  ORF Transcript_85920/g.161806 Transcript_85920/m.161806 type:complete len:212 (+) Transcript_85920:69-704(+)
MFQTLLGPCNGMECNFRGARLHTADRPFNLSVLVHSATLDELDGPGLMQSQQPLVSVSVGNATKESEPGSWSREKGQWCFREALTLQVTCKDEIFVKVLSTTRFSLMGVQAPAMNAHCTGEHSLKVSEVLPRLRTEDRDVEGFVYATPAIPFDLLQEKCVTGRIYLSFETKAPMALLRQNETLASDLGTDARWDGPIGWKRNEGNKQMTKS